MSVTVSAAASLTIKGLNPALGPGLTLLANPELAITNITMGDYFAEVFTVNPSTPATAVNLGKITTGQFIWIQTDTPIDVTLTQNSVSRVFTVDTFMCMNTTYTAVQITNASATNAAHINLVAAGNRVTNPGTPGIF